ncbi:MAG: polysaccharide pyruvyl transferase family protein [Microcystaceae cyanobacterium]
MKIGIITYHFLCNFGANLQVLATVKYLEKLGHQVCVLNYRPPELVEKYKETVPSLQSDAHQQYCETYLPESSICGNQEAIVRVAAEEKFDVVIAGSDAVLRLWTKNLREDTKFPNPFWLTWTEEVGVKRKGVLAASSMGTNYLSFSSDVKSGIREALSRMNHVTVRDRWTKTLLSLISRNRYPLKICPDPVVMMNEVMSIPEEYAKEAIAEKNKYVLLSVYKNTVSEQWITDFVEAAHIKGYKVYSLPLPEYEVQGVVDKVIGFPLSPLEWYAWIQNAAAYVGVRFHPIVCALVNQVPFVALDQYELESNWNPQRRKDKILSKLLGSLIRFSSKTYDVCSTAKRTQYCLNPQQYSQLSPAQILDLATETIDLPTNQSFIANAQNTFVETINKILIK